MRPTTGPSSASAVGRSRYSATGNAAPARGCLRTVLPPVVLAGLWTYLLYGFVSTPALIALCLVGPVLVVGGLYLTMGAARHVDDSPWYLGAFVLGLVMLAGAAASVAPGAPDHLLVTTASGWEILEERARRLRNAIQQEDVGLARRLARRGLGDPAPADENGRPLIHGVTAPDMLSALLESGLDPDARDLEGRTLLLNTWDVEIARMLLAGGADPNARTRDGSHNVLTASLDKDEELLAMLRAAGAEEIGATVAARTDWLVVERDPSSARGPSTVTLDPRPLRRGDTGTLDIRIANDSAEDRRLDVEADLNDAALFVGASHDGAVRNPASPQLRQNIRWPVLALPAHSQGRLELRIVARSDEAVGDLSVDVRIRDQPGVEEAEVLLVHESLRPGERLAPPERRLWLLPLVSAMAVGIWLALRRLRGRVPAAQAAAAWTTGRTVAGLAAVVCAGIAAILVASMAHPFVSFEESTCTVLDRRLLVRTAQNTETGRGLQRPIRRTSTWTYAAPIAAVRIDAGGQEQIATGFATGPATRSLQELRPFALGATVPCWVDPKDRSTFTLVRWPSAAGVVGVALLGLVTLALAAIARHRPAPMSGSAAQSFEMR